MAPGAVPLWIDGKEVTTDTTFEIISPATGKKLWDSSSASVKEALAAVEAAQKAFPAWSQTKPSFRRDIFLKAADIVERRKEEIAKLQDEETASPSSMSLDFSMTLMPDVLRGLAGRIQDALDGSLITTAQPGRAALIVKQPYGVVLGIAPWNATSILGMRAFIFAIAVGNTVVFKGSEFSTKSWWILGDIFREAGLPAGVVNFLFHRTSDAAAVTTALIEHPAIRHVNFTGSTNTGRIIAQQCAKFFKPVILELGGKAPAIICSDADIDKAAMQCAIGTLMHGGQVCMATERVLVHASIADKFLAAYRHCITLVYPQSGDGPTLINSAGVEKNQKLVLNAQAAGATVHRPSDHPNSSSSGKLSESDMAEESKYRMRPIILENVTADMDIYKTESFGPTVSVIRFQGDDEEAAIKIANDTEYGLAASVFTENLQKGIRIAKRIDSGAVHINSMTIHDEAALPHGGFKDSGYGRFGGRWGLEEFLQLKTITFDE